MLQACFLSIIYTHYNFTEIYSRLSTNCKAHGNYPKPLEILFIVLFINDHVTYEEKIKVCVCM